MYRRGRWLQPTLMPRRSGAILPLHLPDGGKANRSVRDRAKLVVADELC
jgi:hypothetical protein